MSLAFEGLLYRALNPVYAREPLSGAGAARYGGRFNPKGTPALYTALSPHTAVCEANQVGTLQPTTLVAYDAHIAPVFDATDDAALAARGLTPEDLRDPAWRTRMTSRGPVPTQDFARALLADGYAALRVPSYARGAAPGAQNLVVWRWNDGSGARLTLIDDDKRLERAMGRSPAP